MRLSWHRCAQYAMFFGYSGGRGRPLSRGTTRGRRKASGGGRFGKRVKTRWIRGPGAPKRVKNAYERCTPHGAVGQTVLPTASGVSPPGSRGAVSRGLRPSWPSPAGSVAGSAHRAVEAKFRPTALGGVRAARVPFRGSVLVYSYVFYRATRCGSGAQTKGFRTPPPDMAPGSSGGDFESGAAVGRRPGFVKTTIKMYVEIVDFAS